MKIYFNMTIDGEPSREDMAKWLRAAAKSVLNNVSSSVTRDGRTGETRCQWSISIETTLGRLLKSREPQK